MPNKLSAAFAKALKFPNTDVTSLLLSAVVFRGLNRAMNRFAVEKCDLKPGERVLDAGCGPGVGLKYALQRVAPRTTEYLRYNPVARMFGPQLPARLGFARLQVSTELDLDGVAHGLDVSPFMIATTKKRLRGYYLSDRLSLHQGSVHNLPIPKSLLDACFHVDSFYFWPSLSASLEHIWRALKPGGRLVAVFSPSRLKMYSQLGWLRYARADPMAYAIALEATGFCDIEWIKGQADTPEGLHCIRARKPPLKLLTMGQIEDNTKC